MDSVWVIEYPSYGEFRVAFSDEKMLSILKEDAESYDEGKVFKINYDHYAVDHKDVEDPECSDPMVIARLHYED